MSIHKILRKIGIVTLREHESEIEEFRAKCEQFAKDYLDASRGVTIGAHDGFINGGTLTYGGVIIGSRVALNNVTSGHMAVAPWAKRVVLNGIIGAGTEPPKNVEAVVRVMRKDENLNGAQVGFGGK